MTARESTTVVLIGFGSGLGVAGALIWQGFHPIELLIWGAVAIGTAAAIFKPASWHIPPYQVDAH